VAILGDAAKTRDAIDEHDLATIEAWKLDTYASAAA
jgi:hypothetical protein